MLTSLRDKIPSSDILKGLIVEPLLLHVERSYLRQCRHLTRMSLGQLRLEVYQAHPTSRKPWGRSSRLLTDYISHLARECLGIPRRCWKMWLGEGILNYLAKPSTTASKPDKKQNVRMDAGRPHVQTSNMIIIVLDKLHWLVSSCYFQQQTFSTTSS